MQVTDRRVLAQRIHCMQLDPQLTGTVYAESPVVPRIQGQFRIAGQFTGEHIGVSSLLSVKASLQWVNSVAAALGLVNDCSSDRPGHIIWQVSAAQLHSTWALGSCLSRIRPVRSTGAVWCRQEENNLLVLYCENLDMPFHTTEPCTSLMHPLDHDRVRSGILVLA